MKCSKCGKDNIVKAQFCNSCGNEFSQKEREDAYNKTIYGKIEKLEKLKAIVTLDFITSNPIFRVALLVIILVCGIIVGRPHGNKLTILESENYSVSQNTQNNDFYVLTDKEEISLGLYIPKEYEFLFLIKCNETEYVEKTNIKENDAVVVESSTQYHYIVEANYKKTTETIKVYVIKK